MTKRTNRPLTAAVTSLAFRFPIPKGFPEGAGDDATPFSVN